MRLSRRRKRPNHHNKPKQKTASASIGLFALIITMAFYSWDMQKNWKRRLETTKYLKEETSSSDEIDVAKMMTVLDIRPALLEVVVSAADRNQHKVTSSSDATTDTDTEALLPLNLIPNNQLREHDYFSDSWIITRDKFLNLERRRLGIVEDACFVAIGSGGSVYPSSKMFVDWTDFSVEHLSKWWNELRILDDQDSSMFQKTLHLFDQYVHHVLERNPTQPTTFHETIAVIAFAPYKSADASRGHLLTYHVLAATLASLYQVGFGRVVIAGYGPTDQHHVEAALEYLAKVASHSDISTRSQSKTQIQMGQTEFGFAKVTNEDWISTQWVKFNMPRGAVIGLQEALLGNIITDSTTDDDEDAVTNGEAWLGRTHDQTYWKYVYLTEPDTILHTKRELLPSIKKGLNDGLSFFPHRLQPIPHGSDVKFHNNTVSSAYAGKYVPNHVLPFSNVTILDPTATSRTLEMDPEGSLGVTAYHCCDAGKSLQHENCGTWWWTCGFHDGIVQADLTEQEILEKHQRLAKYPFMRLQEGTGIVFGPTEHARKCIPSKNPCPMAEGGN